MEPAPKKTRTRTTRTAPQTDTQPDQATAAAPPPVTRKPRARKTAAPAAEPAAELAAEPAASAQMSGEDPASGAIEMTDLRSHVETKTMWCGALEPIAIPGLMGAEVVDVDVDVGIDVGADADAEVAPVLCAPWRLVSIASPHTPALLSVFGEAIVNASDHCFGQLGARRAADRVRSIAIEFDARTGEFAVANDGAGVPVAVHAAGSAEAGRPVYVPEVAFARFLAGSNITKSATSVKGGVFGVGIKAANVHSVRFTVDTVDAAAGLRYTLTCRDRLRVIEAPVIAPVPKSATGYTRVSFLPAYAALGYPAAGPELAARFAELAAWLRFRAALTAAYVGSRAEVTFNGVILPSGAAALAAAAAPGAAPVEFELRSADAPFPWQVAAWVQPERASTRVKKSTAGASTELPTAPPPSVIAIVNGTVTNSGPHVDRARELLWEEVVREILAAKGKRAAARGSAKAAASAKDALGAEEATRLRRRFNDACGLVIAAPLPGAAWDSQTKSRLQVPARVVDGYTIPGGRNATATKSIAQALVGVVLVERAAASTFAHSARKYSRAENAGGSRRADCNLLVAEGDSAIALLRTGLTVTRDVPVGGPSMAWCGLISVVGVVPNALQQTKTGPGGTLIRSKMLVENERLMAVADAMGLRYDRKYDTETELATLKYGRLIICTDQDVDGVGRIAPLIVVWLYVFWPALFRHGRIARLMTPLIRAYPKRGGPPVEFAYASEFEAWAAGDPSRVAAHNINYLKGLSAHSNAEAKRMFEPAAFAASVVTYQLDPGAAASITRFYSADAAPRREVLARPPPVLTAAESMQLRADRVLPIGRVQVDIESHEYSLAAIRAQLPCVIDGLAPTQRKILYASFIRWANGGAPIKVYQLAGFTADRAHYHHGDKSINDCIIGMAQSYIGSNRYPLLEGHGQLGSRFDGKSGSPRYVAARLSAIARAAFPLADRAVLPRVFEDGDESEPRCYVPVAPLAILEAADGSRVSVGWSASSYARSFDDVSGLLDALLAGSPTVIAALNAVDEYGPDDPRAVAAVAATSATHPLRPSTAGYPRGSIREAGGTWSVGAYVEGDASPAVAKTVPAKIPRGRSKATAALAAPAVSQPAVSRPAVSQPGDVVTVVELPQGLKTVDWLERLERLVETGTVSGFVDRSSAESIDVLVDFGSGGRARLPPAEIDPVIDALGLELPMSTRLNFVNEPLVDYGAGAAADVVPPHQKLIVELGSSYHMAFFMWAVARREIYRRRLAREAAVAELRSELLGAIADYADRAAELALSDLDDQAAEDALRRAGLPRLDAGLIRAPPATPTPASLAAFVAAARAPTGAGHDYVFAQRGHDLRPADAGKRRAAASRAAAEHEAAAAALAEQPVAGASIWRAEFASFAAAVARGRTTDQPSENERQHHDE